MEEYSSKNQPQVSVVEVGVDGLFQVNDEIELSQDYIQSLKNKTLNDNVDISFFILQKDGVAIGRAGVMWSGSDMKQVADRFNNVPYLFSMNIIKEQREKGLGSILLDKIFQTVEKRGHEELVLAVNVENSAAIGFYQKNGFKQRVKDPVQLSWHETSSKDEQEVTEKCYILSYQFSG